MWWLRWGCIFRLVTAKHPRCFNTGLKEYKATPWLKIVEEPLLRPPLLSPGGALCHWVARHFNAGAVRCDLLRYSAIRTAMQARCSEIGDSANSRTAA